MARRYRMLIIAASVLLSLPILLCAALLVLANTNRGQRLIEHYTAQLSGGGVLLQGLAGRFPGRLYLARLELRDPKGLWLTAEQVQLDWWPLPLLRGHIRADMLQAARIAIDRAPAYTPSNPPNPSSSLWLRRVRVDRLDVPRLELGAPLVGKAVALRVQGGVSITSWKKASGQLTAQRLDEVPATYRALLHIDSVQVRGQLDLEEDADGPLTHLIQLPALGALALHLTLDGPRQAVQAQLTLHGGALQGSVAGSVNLDTRAAVLQVMLDAPAMSPRAELAWRRLSLHGNWSGTLAAPTTSARLQLAGLVAGARCSSRRSRRICMARAMRWRWMRVWVDWSCLSRSCACWPTSRCKCMPRRGSATRRGRWTLRCHTRCWTRVAAGATLAWLR